MTNHRGARTNETLLSSRITLCAGTAALLWALATGCGDGVLRGGPAHVAGAADPVGALAAGGSGTDPTAVAAPATADPSAAASAPSGTATDAPSSSGASEPAAAGGASAADPAAPAAASGSDSTANTSTPAAPAPGAGPTIAGCPVYPVGQASATDLSALNADISQLPTLSNSDAIVAWIGSDKGLHRDFGPGTNGIPFMIAPQNQPLVDVAFFAYGDESDPGPEGWLQKNALTRQPIPLNAPIEDGSDRHVLVLDPQSCRLYELFDAEVQGSGWSAACGAVFDLRNSALRPIGNTSADAAGLPMIPLLTRYDEVAAGEIRHALRFTVRATRKAFILPATHYTNTGSSSDMPAMGMRFRLKAAVDISGYSPLNKVILTALKKYGMIVADNGGDWYLSGTPDDRWTEAEFRELKQGIRGSDFEVVDSGAIRTSY